MLDCSLLFSPALTIHSIRVCVCFLIYMLPRYSQMQKWSSLSIWPNHWHTDRLALCGSTTETGRGVAPPNGLFVDENVLNYSQALNYGFSLRVHEKFNLCGCWYNWPDAHHQETFGIIRPIQRNECRSTLAPLTVILTLFHTVTESPVKAAAAEEDSPHSPKPCKIRAERLPLWRKMPSCLPLACWRQWAAMKGLGCIQPHN